MASVTEFDKQSENYKELVLPKSVTARVAIEASSMDGWYKYVGPDGSVIGMSSFGESAIAKELFDKFEITASRLLKVINKY